MCKRMIIHLNMDNYVASGFLVPVNIDVVIVKGLPVIHFKCLRKDYQLFIAMLNLWYISGIWST